VRRPSPTGGRRDDDEDDVAHIPDRDEYRRKFASLPFSDRRAIVRAVNRGQLVEKRKHAPLAVVVARRQQRIWRWGWVPAPLIGLLQVNVGVEAVVLNALVGLLFLGGLSRFSYVRAARAEAANLALAEGRKKDAAAITAGRGRPTLPSLRSRRSRG
jgi:hypothetical protein